jgi:uncharacterized membrane-anchored protein
MNWRLAVLVVAAQALLVAFMAAQREWIARTGTLITLRTAPIDPHEPMRGEFVRFRYEINTVNAAALQGGLAAWRHGVDYRTARRLRDHVVYAAIEMSPEGFATLKYLSDEPPAQGLFLRGRVSAVNLGSDGSGTVEVRYGIESMFLQEGAAKRVETLAWTERRSVPIDTKVSLGSSGVGVLRSFEWEPLGLTVIPDPVPVAPRDPNQPRWAPQQPQPSGPRGVTVEFGNFSDRDLAIVDLPDGRAFRLRIDATNGASAYRWVNANKPAAPVKPEELRVIVLHPGQKHRVHLDLNDPRWWVEGGASHESARALRDVHDRWAARFRIEYAPPSAVEIGAAPHADLVRHVPVASPLVTPAGVD